MGRIVVGLDGSEHGERAVRWAAEEARAHGYVLHVVSAFRPPDVVGVPGARFPVEQPEETEARAREHQQEWLTAAVGDEPDLEVRAEVRLGPAAEQLLDAAEDADLLVVGSRGRGGFKGLLLGSVSQQCVTHGTCPTVVIR